MCVIDKYILELFGNIYRNIKKSIMLFRNINSSILKKNRLRLLRKIISLLYYDKLFISPASFKIYERHLSICLK